MMKNSLKSAYTSKICWGMCHLTLNHGMLDRQLKVWVLLSLITMFHHKQLLLVIAISFFTDHSLISSDHYLCMHIIFQFFGISQSAASLTMSCSSWRFSSLIALISLLRTKFNIYIIEFLLFFYRRENQTKPLDNILHKLYKNYAAWFCFQNLNLKIQIILFITVSSIVINIQPCYKLKSIVVRSESFGYVDFGSFVLKGIQISQDVLPFLCH
jgi:hypothetical protein